MNANAQEILKRLVKRAEENGWDYLFTNPHTSTRYKSIKTNWMTACRKANIKDLQYRDLRRTFITHALANGAPITGVKETAGHKNLATTNIYAQATDEGKRRAVEAVEHKFKVVCHNSATDEERQAS